MRLRGIGVSFGDLPLLGKVKRKMLLSARILIGLSVTVVIAWRVFMHLHRIQVMFAPY